jgi:hypothetical protein
MHQFKITGLPEEANELTLAAMPIGANLMYNKLREVTPGVEKEKDTIRFTYDPVSRQAMFDKNSFSEQLILLIDNAGKDGKFG